MEYKDIKKDVKFYAVINFGIKYLTAVEKKHLNKDITFWKCEYTSATQHKFFETIHDHTAIYTNKLDALKELASLLEYELYLTNNEINSYPLN